MSPVDLAGHLNVGGPTLSAAVKRLVQLEYIRQDRHPDDARRVQLRLAPKGARAMRETSVLDAGRVRATLALLKPAQRRAALEGLSMLALAARRMMQEAAHG